MATRLARPSLDSWLADAEGLLADQRARSISPSLFGGSWAGDQYRTTLTMEQVDAGLARLMSQLTASPGRWVFVIEDAREPKHYLQFIGYEDGSLLAEVVSNYFLDEILEGQHSWTKSQEKRLGALGWRLPTPTWKPNWIDIARPCRAPSVRLRRTLCTLRS